MHQPLIWKRARTHAREEDAPQDCVRKALTSRESPPNDPLPSIDLQVDEEAWYDEWSSRLRCWMDVQPYQGAALHRCTVALSLILASRFQSFVGEKAPRVADPNLAHVQPEGDCDWVSKLQLPKFPIFDFHFQTPALPRLVPWGVQKWQELGRQSSLSQEQPHASSSSGIGTGVYVGISGAGFSLGALLMLAVGRLQDSSSSRLQVHRAQEKSEPC